MSSDFKEMLISKEKIAEAVAELGAQISQDFAGEEVLLVCILRGAFIFCADLARSITLPVTIDFIAASSYGSSTESSGNVRINQDLDVDIKGKNVFLVEDIVDSGHTLKLLCEMMRTREPKALRIATLMDKAERRVVDIKPDYCCFNIPDDFVVGYGLDYNNRYRNLPDIMVLAEHVYAE